MPEPISRKVPAMERVVHQFNSIREACLLLGGTEQGRLSQLALVAV
jgi:hypothetical protein